MELGTPKGVRRLSWKVPSTKSPSTARVPQGAGLNGVSPLLRAGCVRQNSKSSTKTRPSDVNQPKVADK